MTYEEVSQLDFIERLSTLKLAYLIVREEQVKKTPQMFKNFAFFKKHTKEEFFKRVQETKKDLKNKGAHDLSVADAIEITQKYTEIALLYHATTQDELGKKPDWIESSLVILWGFEQKAKNMENSDDQKDDDCEDDLSEWFQSLRDKSKTACENATNAGFKVFTKSERKNILRVLREVQKYTQESISILAKNSPDNEEMMKVLLNIVSTMVVLSGVGDDAIARAKNFKKSHKK